MRKKFTVLDLIFSIGHNSDDIPVTVKTRGKRWGLPHPCAAWKTPATVALASWRQK